MWSSISAVVPVYNSEKTLHALYKRITYELEALCSSHEILLIDDNSRDSSYEIMKELHNMDPRVKIIQLNGNFGQQNAIMCGLHYTLGDYIVTLDDDLQNPPEEIKLLLNKLTGDFDVVYGIPLQKKHTLIRNIGSNITNYLFYAACRKPKDIRVSSFRIMTKAIVEKIIKDTTSFVYISAILFKAGARIGNVFVKHDHRSQGESNYNFRKLVKQFFKIYVYYSVLPFKLLIPSNLSL